MIHGKTIDQLNVGDTAEFAKTVTESDIYLFAGVTGDLNPAHVNEVYAKNTIFKGRIAHGMLSAGFISAVLGTLLPGPGTGRSGGAHNRPGGRCRLRRMLLDTHGVLAAAV